MGMPAPVSVDEARRRVLAAVRSLPAEPVALWEARGRVLAEDVLAERDVPAFANSAMDGFAVLAGPAGRRLRVIDEARAGHPSKVGPGAREAVRISTGAPLPAGAEGVARVEDTVEQDGWVLIEAAIGVGENVRAAGEDLRAGQRVLSAGSTLGAAELGLAAGAGRGEVRCARRPRVAVVVTGDELRPPGSPLGPGQIHETNALTLGALAMSWGATLVAHSTVCDERGETERALAAALDAADLLVVSGGASVGPHDHVTGALLQLGVEQRFAGVALRPGKPAWFGTHDSSLVLALPGNPVSAMVTFMLFGRPALRALQGAPPLSERLTATLAEPIRLGPREHAVRVTLMHRDGQLSVRTTGPQESHVLSSMLGAEALAMIPAGEGTLPAGSAVAIELIA